MEANFKGKVCLDESLRIGDTVVLEVVAAVNRLEAPEIDTWTLGDPQESVTLGATMAHLVVVDSRRVRGGQTYDPRAKERELLRQIYDQNTEINQMKALLARAEKRNPNGANVPALLKTIENLRDGRRRWFR